MQKRISFFWAAVFLLVSLLVQAQAEAPVAPSAGQASLTPDQQAAAATQLYGASTSISWALFEDGVITKSGTLGADGAYTDDSPLYGVGSVSKVYTAAAAMKLADAGKLDLDESVTTYLPEFTMADARYRDITVRHLLNHASGLMLAGMNDAFLFDDPQNNTANDTLLEQLSTSRLIADPGAYSVYCNTGFSLAQLVIERVSGMAFGDFLRESFFSPLGLTNTFSCSDTFDRDALAPAFLPMDSTRPVAHDTTTIAGTGGLYATAKDLAHFGGMLADEGGLLSAQSLQEMAGDEYARGLWPQSSENDALSYGLGWDAVHMFPFNQSGITALCKGGDTNLYHAALVVLPEYDMAAAVLSSGGVSTYSQLFAARLLIDALAARGVTVNESAALPPALPAPMPAELTAFSGLYGTSTYPFDVTITEDGQLTLTMHEELGGAQQALTYHDDGSFRDETGSVLVRLVTEENGETYFFQQSYGGLPGLTTMASSAYAAQKLRPNALDSETKAAWQAREGKLYFLMNAGWTSQIYALAMPYTFVSKSWAEQGYEGSYLITGPNTLEAVVNIPGTGGRDTMDMTFTAEGGVEYLTAPGYIYADESVVQPLETQQSISIGEDGFARWFSIGDALDGMTLTVSLPENGSFAVYGADKTPTASSAAYGNADAALQAGGYVVFAGDAGAAFDVSVE